MAETDEITGPVLVRLSAMPGAMFWRQNVGTFRTMDGRRVVRIGPDGAGDIMGVYFGRAVAVETKTLKGRHRETQARFRDAFVLRGGVYVTIRAVEECEDALLQAIENSR